MVVYRPAPESSLVRRAYGARSRGRARLHSTIPRSGAALRTGAGAIVIVLGSAVVGAVLPGDRAAASILGAAAALFAGAAVQSRVQHDAARISFVYAAVLAVSLYMFKTSTALETSLGFALGAAAYTCAASRHLRFLDGSGALTALRREIPNAANLFIHNSAARWDRMYAAGAWECLRGPAQRPRHYIISGLIRERFPHGAAVLDVGCGQGVVYPLIRGPRTTYVGIDISRSAIEGCRREFECDPRATFIHAGFEDLSLDRAYDVVIFNEVLYYFPLDVVLPVFERAMRALQGVDGVIVVSMGDNPKASRVATILADVCPAERRIQTATIGGGGPWTVTLHVPAAVAEDCRHDAPRPDLRGGRSGPMLGARGIDLRQAGSRHNA